MMGAGVVISTYDRTGNIAKPWADAGYLCYCVDKRHKPGEHRKGNMIYVGADMRLWVPPRHIVPRVAFYCSFPDCTNTASSGAKWFKAKGLSALRESIELFERGVFWAEWLGAPYFIEHPVSVMSTHWRKPDYTFHPWQYSLFSRDDNYTKETCLWTGNGFVMPDPAIDGALGQPDNRIHHCAPGPDRADIRAATPYGFAQAVFLANESLARKRLLQSKPNEFQNFLSTREEP